MDPRRLLTFRAVAHEQSFSKAARRLLISQPSVSQQIALLETEAGVRLFDRGKGGLRLTHAGELLLTHADHIAWRLLLAERQIAGLAAERRDRLRIGAFPTALAGLVPAAIAEFQRDHHDVSVEIHEVTPSVLEGRLLQGEFDIAVSYQDSASPRADMADARRIDLLQETFLLAMPADHRLARGTKPIELTALAAEDWVVPSSDGFIIQACRDAGFEPHVVSISQDPLAMRGLIGRGIAIGIVPSLLADAYSGIVLRDVAGPMPRRDVFAVLPPGEHHPMAPAALDAMQRTARSFQPQR
ncbi:MAG: LysR family transcriptional regulator [Thermoleophilia bacterium]|nr:LysR family transcriptional regulator [Thermoleophilia bacterium]